MQCIQELIRQIADGVWKLRGSLMASSATVHPFYFLGGKLLGEEIGNTIVLQCLEGGPQPIDSIRHAVEVTIGIDINGEVNILQQCPDRLPVIVPAYLCAIGARKRFQTVFTKGGAVQFRQSAVKIKVTLPRCLRADLGV